MILDWTTGPTDCGQTDCGQADPEPTEPPHRDVTGPHPGYDRYGDLDHYYYRCERCGHETTDAGIRDGCPDCDGAGG